MISLTSLLPKLPSNKVKELELVTQRIIDSGNAEIIILFGSYARGDFKPESQFNERKRSDFDLLIVTADEETQKAVQIRFGLYAFSFIDTVVQLVVEPIRDVNVRLENKHYFFTDIRKEGIVLYDSGKFKLAEPKPLPMEKRIELAEHNFKTGFKRATGFYRQFQHAIDDRDFEIAAFNLHQTVEFSYKTIELVFTEYMLNEHYLFMLRNHVKQFNARIDEPFPIHTEELKFLFQHLDLAYIGARYLIEDPKVTYDVTKEQLDYWSVEATKLLKITEEVCTEKIERMRGDL